MKKTFQMKKPLWLTVLLALSAALLATGAVANALRLRYWAELTPQNRVAVPVFVAVFALFCVLALAFIFAARYEVKKGALYACYGLIKMRLSVSEIEEAVKREKSKKLVLRLKEEGVCFVQIEMNDCSAFIDALKAAGGGFSYSIDYEEDGVQ